MTPIVKRWVIFGICLVLLTVTMAMCLGGGDAEAATIAEELPAKTTFTVVLEPATLVRSTGECWQWDFGWSNNDGFGRLRFGYGEKLIACTNLARTKWISTPTFDPYHWLGYWQHDKTTKSKSTMGYSFLDISTVWKFSWSPGFGMPTYHKDRTLRCSLNASTHTASCTIYN